MNILGIGPLELLLIAIVAVIVLGPKGMVNGAREAGKMIRRIVRSPLWQDVVNTSREIREFPRKIVREAGIEQDLEDLRRSTRETVSEINHIPHPQITAITEENTEEQKDCSKKKAGDA